MRDPWLLALAVLVPLALWRRRRARGVVFAPAPLLAAGLPGTWRTRARGLPRALQALGVLCAIAALARPAERAPVPHATEGLDALLCLDVSSSMTARDMDRERTRLEVARDAAARFLRGRPDDRLGLLAFARYPDLVCPPTLDHGALLRFLDDVATVPADGAEDATGLGTALARAAQALADGAARSPVVILLTDGAETVATKGAPGEIAPVHAAQLCARLGVRLYVVALGGGDALADAARRTGGGSFAARDAAGVDAVVGRIDALERSRFVEARVELRDRFAPLLLAALALLAAGRALGATVLGVLP